MIFISMINTAGSRRGGVKKTMFEEYKRKHSFSKMINPNPCKFCGNAPIVCFIDDGALSENEIQVLAVCQRCYRASKPICSNYFFYETAWNAAISEWNKVN